MLSDSIRIVCKARVSAYNTIYLRYILTYLPLKIVSLGPDYFILFFFLNYALYD